MDALIRSPVNPTCYALVQQQSRFFRKVALRLPNSPFTHSFGGMKSYKPLTSIAASPQSQIISTNNYTNIKPTKEVLEIWHSADAVCFDVDSTVCLDEGIDELADFCGAGEAVSQWTARAMNGSIPFEDALAARLSLFNPSLNQVQEFLEKRPPRISPGMAEVCKKLTSKNKVIYLISGGFRQMINPVALQLGIPIEHIFANQLLFASSGEFVGFDTTEPTSRSGGKATAVENIRKVHGYKLMVMIGDGATDLEVCHKINKVMIEKKQEQKYDNEVITILTTIEAKGPGGADLFICYGGVQLRPAVAASADWLVFSFQELLNSLA